MEFVKVELAELVNVFAGDCEKQARRPETGPIAVRARVLHHDFFQPRFYARTCFTTLTIPPVVALNASGDTVEADFFTLPVVTLDLGFRRRSEPYFSSLHSVKDHVLDGFGKLLPGCIQRKAFAARKAV